jgi:hypothetical protein
MATRQERKEQIKEAIVGLTVTGVRYEHNAVILELGKATELHFDTLFDYDGAILRTNVYKKTTQHVVGVDLD